MDGRAVIDVIADAWLERCRDERVPANTIAARTRVLRSLGNPGTATRDEVEAWWSSRAGLAPATRANDLAILRSFYRWCRRWERRDDDPTIRLDAPKVPNGVARALGRSDLHRLLGSLPDDLRRAVCLGAYGGLRVSEAAALDWSNVDVEGRRVYVMDSKGSKSRVVKVSVVLLDQLLPETGGNVVTAGGEVYSAAALQRRANRAIKGAGVKATFHQLRHRYGVLAYQATGDLLAVGKQMGHSSPVTTAIYAEASTEMADRIADAVVR